MKASATNRGGVRWASIGKSAALAIMLSVVIAGGGCSTPAQHLPVERLADERPTTEYPAAENPTVALINRSAGSEDVRNSLFCGGVLVAPREVVTVAHCVRDGAPPDVLVGVDDVCGAVDPARRAPVESIVLGTGAFRELASLRLASPVASTWSVTAAPRVDPVPSESAGKNVRWAFGWGAKCREGIVLAQ
ncbi:trypsin-like serine protease [Leucobacter sp.]